MFRSGWPSSVLFVALFANGFLAVVKSACDEEGLMKCLEQLDEEPMHWKIENEANETLYMCQHFKKAINCHKDHDCPVQEALVDKQKSQMAQMKYPCDGASLVASALTITGLLVMLWTSDRWSIKI